MCGSTARLTRCVPEHVDVVLHRELLGQERLGRAKHHVTRIVDQHPDLAALGHDLLDRHILAFSPNAEDRKKRVDPVQTFIGTRSICAISLC
jgi:hypothetical protein